MPATSPQPFIVRDYSTYLATSLVYLEQARDLIAQSLPYEADGSVKRDPANFWYNQWANLGEEIARLQPVVERVRRVLEAVQKGQTLPGIPLAVEPPTR